MHRQFGRYLAVQVVAYAIDVGGFLLVLWLFEGFPVLANCAGKIAAGCFAFFAHRMFTFSGARSGDAKAQALKYALLLLANIPVSSAALALLLLVCPVEIVAKVIADTLAVLLTFAISHRFVFKQSGGPRA
jgi:putative flippase GtrA